MTSRGDPNRGFCFRVTSPVFWILFELFTRDRLPSRLRGEIQPVERATAGGKRIRVRIALDYSSRESIIRLVARLGAGLPPSVATFDRLLTESFSDFPLRGGIDLLLRSGGEKRLSDFLLWECALAELVFNLRMWPDFDGTDLRARTPFRRYHCARREE
jgi:undecaprenyl diphosphate synthase